MRLPTPLLAVLVLLLTPAAFADAPPETKEECGDDVDLSDRFVEPRDQGSAGFCYSFTASELVAEAADLPPPETISAFHAGSHYVSLTPDEVMAANQRIEYKVSSSVPPVPKALTVPVNAGKMGMPGNGTSMEGMGMLPSDKPFASTANIAPGGMIGMLGGEPPQIAFWRNQPMKGLPLLTREAGYIEVIAAHLLNQGKACLESEVPSQMMLRSAKDSEQRHFFMIRMGQLAGGDAFQAFANERKRAAAVAAVDPLHPFCFQKAPEVFEYRKPLEDLHSALQDWAAAKLRKEADDRCHNPVALPSKLRIQTLSYDNPLTRGPDIKAARADTKRLFDNKRPFGLSYDTCVMHDSDDCRAGKKGHHASIVVGRHWNEKRQQCELKIKNSWGPSCAGKLPDVKCEKGYWYVSADKIYQAGHLKTWIEK